MECIAYCSRHSRISCHFCNHSISCDTSFGNLFHSLVYFLRRAICYEIIAFGYHSPDLLLWNRPIQNNRVPMFFMLVIASRHRFVGTSPEVAPLGIDFHIQIYISVTVVDPQKYFSIFFYSYHLPVLITERVLLVHVVK